MPEKMNIPKPLNPGDTIGLVSPAFPIKPEECDQCVRVLEQMGYQVKRGFCLERMLNIHGYLAGDAISRADDINRMFADSGIKAVFCTRGGYGSSHIMPYLDFDLIRRNPKIFVGYSDITNLHTAFQMFCKLVTFHGPMVYSNMLSHFDPYTSESLWKTLDFGKTPAEPLEFHNPPGENGFVTLRDGVAEGILAGGNVALLARACGTFFQLDGRGKILFLEDVDESIPVLDMYLTQMEYAGVFQGVRGILLGDFTGCNNDRYDGNYKIHNFFQDRFSSYKIPVISNICSGHGKPMGTLPMGSICRIDGRKKKIVFYRETLD